MSPLKYKVNKITKDGYDRLHIIDEIISKSLGAITREFLLKKVNSNLEESLKISRPTLDKDIKKLRAVLKKKSPHVKLKNNTSKGYYYSEKGYCLFTSSITEEDTSSLLLAKELFQLLKGSSLQPKFDEVVNKIMQLSLEEGIQISEPPVSYISITGHTPAQGVQWIENIIKAIYNKDALLMKYRKNNGALTERHISPYLLKQYQNRWYLLAHDHNSSHENKELVFSLNGIQDLTYSNKKYVPPVLNVKDYFKYSIGIWHEHTKDPIEVKLLFKDENVIQSIIANPIHHTQTCERNSENQNLIVTITVYPGPEVESLIFHYSDKVKVLSPDSLLERIMLKIDKMKALYT